jgi:hypothetical protein
MRYGLMQSYPLGKPYGRPRRRFSLLVPALAVLVAIGIAAALFLPTWLTKRSLDGLIAQLPPGTSLSYDGVTYGLFSQTLELRQATYETGGEPGQPFKITAASLTLVGGNMHLDRDASTKQGLTRIANQLVLKDAASQYGPFSVHADQITLTDPQFDFAGFDAPLAPLQPSSLPLGEALAQVQAALQKVARDVSATAFDRLAAQGLTFTLKDPKSPTSIVLKLATMGSDHMTRGSYSAVTTSGLELQSDFLRLTIDSTETGAAPNAPFWQAIRDGAPLEVAATNFQGAPQTIHGLHLLNATTEMASIASVSIGNLAYDQGKPTSLDASLEKLQVNLAAIPLPMVAMIRQLGYEQLVLGGALQYRFDPATKVARVDNTSLTLDQGGTLALTASFQQPEITPEVKPTGPKLVGMTLRYDDNGLFGRVLAQQAKLARQPEDAVQQSWLASLEKERQDLQADPVSAAAVAQMEAFVTSPQSLTMTLAPPAPVTIGDFDRTHPEQFAAQLGLVLKAD